MHPPLGWPVNRQVIVHHSWSWYTTFLLEPFNNKSTTMPLVESWIHNKHISFFNAAGLGPATMQSQKRQQYCTITYTSYPGLIKIYTFTTQWVSQSPLRAVNSTQRSPCADRQIACYVCHPPGGTNITTGHNSPHPWSPTSQPLTLFIYGPSRSTTLTEFTINYY